MPAFRAVEAPSSTLVPQKDEIPYPAELWCRPAATISASCVSVLLLLRLVPKEWTCQGSRLAVDEEMNCDSFASTTRVKDQSTNAVPGLPSDILCILVNIRHGRPTTLS